MVNGISDIVSGVHSSKGYRDALAGGTYMEELRAKCSPKRLEELLSRNCDQDFEQRGNSRRAAKLLKKAAFAAANGNAQRRDQMQLLALEAVGGDKDEIAVLIEEHRLSFAIHPAVQPTIDQPRVRHGFAPVY